MLIVLVVVLALWPSTALAAFPGANGRLVVAQEGCSFDQRYLSSLPWRGGDLTAITDPCDDAEELGDTAYDIYNPTASPDGHTIVAVQYDIGYDGHGTGPSFLEVQSDGNDRRTIPLPHPESYSVRDPAFAPEGERFAFIDPFPSEGASSSVWEMRLDGSRARAIHPEPTCDRQSPTSCNAFENPSWSPDGRLIAVVVHTVVYNRGEKVPVKPGIWLMRARNGELVRRVADRGEWVDWAPSGRKLVYATNFRSAPDGASGGNLFVVDRDGEHTRSLVHRRKTAEVEPVWSPDGRWIAWISMRYIGEDWAAAVWRVRARGGRVRRVKELSQVTGIDGMFDIPDLTWFSRPR